MRKDIERCELIERYLKNQMSGSELHDFENLLKTDKGLFDEVQQQKLVHQYINESSFINLKSEIRTIHQKHSEIGLTRPGLNFLWILPAGILITVLIVFIIKNGTVNNEVETALMISDTNQLEVDLSGDTTNKSLHSITTEIAKPEKNTTNIKDSNKTTPSFVTLKKVTDTLIKTANTKEANQILEEIKDTLNKNIGTVKNEEEENIALEKPFRLTTNCSGINVTAEVLVEESCTEKPTGILHIEKSSITGGESPYLFAIDSGFFKNENIFEGLSSDYYFVFIKDKNNCVSKLGAFFIDEDDCRAEYKFAPLKGEMWPVPSQNSLAVLKIFNKTGKMVFTNELVPNIQYEWDGRSISGAELPMGIYLFEIKSEKQILSWGNVTIIR